MQMRTSWWVTVLTGLSLVGWTLADERVYTGSVAGPIPDQFDVVVPQFNADPNGDGIAEYQLTAVTLQVSGIQDAVLDLHNNNAAKQWTVNLNQGSIAFGNDTLQATALPVYSRTLSVSPGTTRISATSVAASDAQTYHDGLAAFIGDGSVNNMAVCFDGSWGAMGMRNGDSTTIISYTGTADWAMTYEYGTITPVPEPGVCALLGLGGLTIALCGRLHRRRTPLVATTRRAR